MNAEVHVINVGGRDIVEVQFRDSKGRVGCEQFDVQDYLDDQEVEQACALLNELTMPENPTEWLKNTGSSAFAASAKHIAVKDTDIKEVDTITLERLRAELLEHISWTEHWIRRAREVLPTNTSSGPCAHSGE